MSQVAQYAETRGAVREVPLPDDVRALSTLGRIDYSDSYLVAGVPSLTAEQWARATLDDAPLLNRTRLLAGWTALGLKLALPRSDRTVLGWRVQHRTSDIVVLGAGSRFGLAGNLVFARRPDGLLFATLTQQENAIARAVWARIVTEHHRVVRSLLRHAAARELRHHG